MVYRTVSALLAVVLLSIGSIAHAGDPPEYVGLYIQIHGLGIVIVNGTDPNGGEVYEECWTAGLCQHAWLKDSVVTLTATPGTNYSWAGWGQDCATNSGLTCDLTLDQDRNVDVSFAPPDQDAPTARMTKPSFPVVASRTIPLEWSGDDGDGSGIASFDITYRSEKYSRSVLGRRNKAPGLTGATTTTGTFTGQPGNTYCFEAKAHDVAGNLSAGSVGWNCATVPVDDKSLTHSSGWTQRSNQNGYFEKTFSVTTGLGKTLTLTGVKAKQVGILAKVCKTCGKLTFKFGGSTWMANLRANSTRTVLFYTPIYNGITTSSLVVKSTTSGKTVQVDGVFAIVSGNRIGEDTVAAGFSAVATKVVMR